MDKIAKKNKISVIGLVGESNFYKVDRFAVNGETVPAKSFHREYGGKGFNQAVAAKRYGVDVNYLTVLGNDEIKDHVIRILEEELIDYKIITKTGQSACASILIDNKGDNEVICFPGVSNQITKLDVKSFEKEIAESKVLLLQNELNEESILQAIQIAQKYDTLVILNPAPAIPQPLSLYKECFLITPNENEVRKIFKENKLTIRQLLTKKDYNICVTLGDKGSLLKFNGKLTKINPLKVNQLNSTGAGDTFNGILAASICEGDDVVTACTKASIGASLSVTKEYVIDSIPFRRDIEKALNNNNR